MGLLSFDRSCVCVCCSIRSSYTCASCPGPLVSQSVLLGHYHGKFAPVHRLRFASVEHQQRRQSRALLWVVCTHRGE
jgi:hypothetical protein